MNLEGHYALAVQHEKARVKKKLFYAILLLFTVYVLAIELYHYLEGWDWLDSVYFTTATITTVGYGDLAPQTELWKIVTIPLMLVGIAIGFYAIYAIQDYGKAHLSDVARQVDSGVDDAEKARTGIRRRAGEHFERHIGSRLRKR